jgi:hypothetical protein
VLGFAYLLALAFGFLPTGRFGMPEAIIFVAILLLNPGLVGRLESLSLGAGKLDVKLREELRYEVRQEIRPVQDEQARQRNILQELGFLITSYLPFVELEYLTNIAEANQAEFNSARTADFRGSLRHLRDLGLIAHREPLTPVANLPNQGRLQDFFVVTDRGRLYLDLRRRAEAAGSPQ